MHLQTREKEGGLVSLGAIAQTWGQGLDVLPSSSHASGENEKVGATTNAQMRKIQIKRPR